MTNQEERGPFLPVTISREPPRDLDELTELAGVADDLKQRRILAAVLLVFGITGALLAVLIGETLVVVGGAVVFGLMIYGGIRVVLTTERLLTQVRRAITEGEVVSATVEKAVPSKSAPGKMRCELTYPVADARGSAVVDLLGDWSEGDQTDILVADAGESVLVPLKHGLKLRPVDGPSPKPVPVVG